MGIPALNSEGNLPPGLHKATVEEIVQKFCIGTPARTRLEEPLQLLVDVARKAQSPGLYINGSFVSEKPHPNDFDAVIVLPRGFDVAGHLALEIRRIYHEYGIDIERVHQHDREELDYLLNDFFGSDRNGRPRGLLEVVL